MVIMVMAHYLVVRDQAPDQPQYQLHVPVLDVRVA